jgi:hypothetical protein
VTVDEDAEAVEDAPQAEVVGVVGAVGRAVGSAHTGGGGVFVLVEDVGQEGALAA